MAAFLYILQQILVPIVILVGIGYIFQRVFKVDIRTFSKLMIYILIPVVIFTKIYQAKVTWNFFVMVVLYVIFLEVCLFGIGEMISRFLKYPRSMRKAFSNSLLLFNSGNYGIPLTDLVFKNNPVTMMSQLFIVVIQNITSNTFGVFQASSGNSSRKEALFNMLKMPSLYVVFLVALVKLGNIQIPIPVIVPLDYISNGFVGLALINLGVQLAEIRLNIRIKDVLMASFIRLVVSPLIGLVLVFLFGIKGMLAQALIIGVSTPSAVNSVIIAKEFENEPEYVAQIVFATTVLSSITIPIVIYFCMKYL